MNDNNNDDSSRDVFVEREREKRRGLFYDQRTGYLVMRGYFLLCIY
jgi:hypothetical protein